MEGLVFPFISFNFGLLGPKFSSPAARFKGLRQGGGTACTEIATLAVTIMPAWSRAPVAAPGQQVLKGFPRAVRPAATSLVQ